MKIPWFIFFACLGMTTMLVIAFSTPQVPYEDVVKEDGTTERIILSHGFEHPGYPSMEHGGPGAERHEVTTWVGLGFVTFCILFYSGCMFLGIARHGKIGPAKTPIIIGTGIFIAIFAALVLSYRGYMNEETHSLFLSFPKPSAWMLLAVWPFPAWFLVVYYRQFDGWHFTQEDEKRLQTIVANRQRKISGNH